MAIIDGTIGNDNIRGTSDPDVINGLAGHDSIFGYEGDDQLQGNEGDDSLYGYAGADQLFGGTGNDTLVGAFGTGPGAQAGDAADLLDGGEGDDVLRGGDGDDTLLGGIGDDNLRGDLGNDTLDGGDGFDFVSYRFDDLNGPVSVDFSTVTGGTNSINDQRGGTDTVSNFERIGIAGSRGADTLWGSNFIANQITGEGGADTIQGGSTNDLLFGDDSQGTSSGYGNDTVYGNDGNDTILGGIGNDELDGGLGFDTVAYDYSMLAGPVSVDFSQVGGTAQGVGDGRGGTDSIANFEQLGIDGSRGNDTLIGSDLLANGISGYGGADTITGGSLDDLLIGDDGAGAADGDDIIDGKGGDDTISGGAGNDTLTGGTGADTIDGGLGNDTYVNVDATDQIIELADQGSDTIQAANYYLPDHVENLDMRPLVNPGPGLVYGVGNGLSNAIWGTAGVNLLLGGDGIDALEGLDGDDSLFGESGNDLLYGGNGIDYVVGGIGNDTLRGQADPDALYGEDGDDTLDGGDSYHTDILVGGAGNDTLDGVSGQANPDYDLMDGGSGDDGYWVDTGDDLTFEAADGGIDTVYANVTVPNAGVYLYPNIENLVLEGTTAFGVGNELDNHLTGSASGNWLLGGSGNDVIAGLAGNDVLFGEGGADTFVFAAGTGADLVGDFVAGTDKIQLNGLYANFAEVQAAFHQVGADGAIDLGGGNLIVLLNVQLSTLSASDFIFSTAGEAQSAASKVWPESAPVFAEIPVSHAIDGAEAIHGLTLAQF